MSTNIGVVGCPIFSYRASRQLRSRYRALVQKSTGPRLCSLLHRICSDFFSRKGEQADSDLLRGWRRIFLLQWSNIYVWSLCRAHCRPHNLNVWLPLQQNVRETCLANLTETQLSQVCSAAAVSGKQDLKYTSTKSVVTTCVFGDRF